MNTNVLSRIAVIYVAVAAAALLNSNVTSARAYGTPVSGYERIAAALAALPLGSTPASALEPPLIVLPAPEPQNNNVTQPAGEGNAAKDTNRPPVKPAPAESRTPDEASARAADPKDPSGALIFKSPGAEVFPESNVDSP